MVFERRIGDFMPSQAGTKKEKLSPKTQRTRKAFFREPSATLRLCVRFFFQSNYRNSFSRLCRTLITSKLAFEDGLLHRFFAVVAGMLQPVARFHPAHLALGLEAAAFVLAEGRFILEYYFLTLCK
jgi:hypothetical protein